jgi:hypothetical protein
MMIPRLTKQHKGTVTLALFLSAALSTSAATPAPKPKVVFLGDQITMGWTQAFAANPTWINANEEHLKPP